MAGFNFRAELTSSGVAEPFSSRKSKMPMSIDVFNISLCHAPLTISIRVLGNKDCFMFDIIKEKYAEIVYVGIF